MSGWICLHRSFQKHWLFNFDEPEKSLAWIDLLLSANHDDKEFLIKGRVVKCNRGQVAMSQQTLQKRWKWSQNKVKRFLELLKKHSMIVFETNDLTTIISICNYDKYQDSERPDGRPDGRPDERATDDQTDDKQQYNNVNNVNKNISAKAHKFIKPTINDLIDYCNERANNVDCERWFAFYESNGWKVGKNPMKDWKAAIRTWEKNQSFEKKTKVKIDYGEYTGDLL